jgi:ATP-dependent Lon protease
MFIATANIADPIPAPLRDRMEILEIPGYTRREKLAIARQHLLPKQIEEHGLSEDMLEITDDAIEEIIDHYTREAGVRSLERQVASVIRGVAVKVAEGDTQKRRVDNEDDLHEFLGAPKYTSEVAERTARRAWRRASRGPASAARSSSSRRRDVRLTGKLQLTGQLGDVMKESAQAASQLRPHQRREVRHPEGFPREERHPHPHPRRRACRRTARAPA